MSLDELLSYLQETEKWFVSQAASKTYAAIDSSRRLQEAIDRLGGEKLALLKHGLLDEIALMRLATTAVNGTVPNDSWRKLLTLVKQAAANQRAAIDSLDAGLPLGASWRNDDPKWHDELVPIGSKRCYEEDIQAATNASSGDEPLSLLVIDVDDFKSVNEVHGHQIGDDVLKTIAGVLASSVTGKGKAYRWGGDEFAVLLPNHTLSEAGAVAERIRSGVEGQSFGSPELRVTITIGCAVLPEEPNRTARGLFEAADAALRSAKREGKNRVYGENPALVAPGNATPVPSTSDRDPFLRELLAAALPAGEIFIVDTDQEAAWVQAGKRSYRFDDRALTAEYRDALRRGEREGVLESVGGRAFRLTARGFALARAGDISNGVASQLPTRRLGPLM
jgi:diguanylate cyclase (GGDEF)-like protein